jgi:hypothetical protein
MPLTMGASPPNPRAERQLSSILRRHRDLLLVTLAALAVRLGWNLAVHRPLDYAFSDMGGYLERAQTSIDFPHEPRGYFALFPWGTHWLLSLIKRAFGRDNGTAVGVVYAVVGALAVAYGFALARRFTRSPRLARVVGVVLVFYYPWISLGGYVLSEPPFTLFLGATALHGLAYADRGRARDAWLFGLALAAGAIFRPQILAALPLYGLHALARRRAWHGLRPRVIVPAIAAPLAVVLVVSAWRTHFHTGKYGFIAGNGPLNYAFGRCHATSISAVAPDRRSGYSPPSLGALAARDASAPGSFVGLDPAREKSITVAGHIWEAEPFDTLAADCVRRTGPVRQARYAAVHLVLLWFYDTMWPDAGQPGFGPAMAFAQGVHDIAVLPAAMAAVAGAFRRRRARTMLLALHLLALMGVAMIYFGDTRLRAPYDGILIVLAATTYAAVPRELRRRRPRPSAAHAG